MYQREITVRGVTQISFVGADSVSMLGNGTYAGANWFPGLDKDTNGNDYYYRAIVDLHAKNAQGIESLVASGSSTPINP
jgi:hypothetical protein